MAELVLCAGPCGQRKPQTPQYFQQRPSGYFVTICKVCEAGRRKLQRDRRRDAEFDGSHSDWAWYLRRDQLRQRFKGTSITATRFEYDMLRALMRVQEYTCPLSGTQLYLPTPQDLDNTFPGWGKWCKSLAVEQRQRTPVFTRIVDDRDWTPGNLIYIAAMWEDIYERAGGLQPCRKMCGQAALLTGGVQQEFKLPSEVLVMTELWSIRGARHTTAARCERNAYE
jgi:hypothetical protein